jgi:alcohol dehydrogenase class IV
MAMNISALQRRATDSPSLARYEEVARIVTGRANATAADGINWVQKTCAVLKLPPLSEYGITETDFPSLIEKAQMASSMKGNPVQLAESELSEILQQAL